MNATQLAALYEEIFHEIRDIRANAQKDYARNSDRPFANFERIAERVGLSRERVWSIYFEKHIDAIHAWIDGADSSREPIEGRILDALNYLLLLWGMAAERRAQEGEEDFPDVSPPRLRLSSRLLKLAGNLPQTPTSREHDTQGLRVSWGSPPSTEASPPTSAASPQESPQS